MTTSPVRPGDSPGSQTGHESAWPVTTPARDEGTRAVRSGVTAITPTHALVGSPAETLRLLAMIEEHQRKPRTALRAPNRAGSTQVSVRPGQGPIARTETQRP